MSVTSRPLARPYVTADVRNRRLAPKWAHEAAEWLTEQPDSWRVIGGLLGVIMLAFGASLLFGGGYTTIQGIRVPLAAALRVWDIPLVTTGLPSLAWWIIPAVTNVIQIFARRFPGLRPLWWPSIIFDTGTTAVFLGYVALYSIVGNVTIIHVVAFGLAASIVGLLLTIYAEQLFLAGLLMIKTTLTGSH